jgi:membrane complex biogenesis BtpA family protein
MTQKRTSFPGLCAVVHLPPLPGSFRGVRSKHSAHELLQAAGQWAVSEAHAFAEMGFDSVILENFGDVPFARDRVEASTVAAMAVIAGAVREGVKIPVGINVLRNDARSALAIAAVTGCDFIRVNVLSGVAATDQGWIEGDAPALLRDREGLDASLRILADVWVKHARQFSSDTIGQAIEETALRAGADGVIVTGSSTGRLADQARIQEAMRTCKEHQIPLVLGSGVSTENMTAIPAGVLSGVIVGSALRVDGRAGARIDSKRAARWIAAARKHGLVRKR